VSSDRLIFVYNADAGLAQGILDSVHKLVSPATYRCSLCAVTHGALRMDPKWRAWLKQLPVPPAFYHRDDSPFTGIELPVVLIQREGAAEVLIPAERLNTLRSVDALIAAIEAELREPA